MNKAEGIHGDWEHLTGEEAGRDWEALVEAEEPGEELFAREETALATGGEGAVELEGTAPARGSDTVEVLDPLDEAGRDAMRRETATNMDRPHLTIDKLEPGPDGQYITGSPGA